MKEKELFNKTHLNIEDRCVFGSGYGFESGNSRSR